MALAGLRLAGWLALGAVGGTIAGTATVRGMNEASAYAPPAAGTESAALAQLAAEASPGPQPEAETVACAECADGAAYVRVSGPEQYSPGESDEDRDVGSEDSDPDRSDFEMDESIGDPHFQESPASSY